MKTISRRARPHKVTVYNFLSSANGVASYQRTVIDLVHLDVSYQQRLSLRGIQTEDAVAMIVDLSDLVVTDGRTFVTGDAWKKLTPEQRAQHFTFRVTDDFFVEGEAEATLPPETKASIQKLHRCYAVSRLSIPASARRGPVILEVIGR